MASTERGDRPLIEKAQRDSLRRALLDFFLPISCVVCERLVPYNEDGIVCGHCWSKVVELPHPRCDRCGHPRGRFECTWCDFLPPFVRAARSYCWVSAGTGGHIVHALKYSGWKIVSKAMSERIDRLAWPADVVAERNAMIPVPLARSRERERGYNQSTMLARELALRWKIPVWDDVVERARATRTQTELTPGERLTNVAGAFRVRDNTARKLRGAHVVIVDDVVTTGATLASCAFALFEAGARIISYVTFGRAAAAGDRLQP
ncbi:MAG TPA: double zinc ribbon domain-containing protein [Gemmatimonadaceae bacterium]|nr:double zinc ribbon domain-containing protein [Gemmatimonadaceae bacterium]